jgi:hypothetical protein
MAIMEPQRTYGNVDVPSGFGWTLFAGTLLLLASFVTGIWALTALFDDSFVRESGLLTGNRTFWGIVLLGVATLQGITGILVYAGNRKGAILGIAIASVNFIAHLFAVGGYPIWSVTAMGLDVLIIYALCSYGFER